MNMRKTVFAVIAAMAMAAAFAQQTVQVLMPEGVNLTGSEAAWLPGQIQDKLKSNLQEYLGMNTVVDAKSEATLKQLQRESEGSGRDADTAIELGKISTAKFAVMTRIRRTGKGYTISADYTDLTTGVQKATATSKEYTTSEELYASTGAIDEITLILAEKLHIAVNHVQKQALQYGTADFSIDDQLTLARQNEEQYKKMMSQFDEQLRALSVSNDLSAVENAKKIEAEKALLAEKQKNEQKRLAELAEQKKKAAEDALKEAARTDEQKKRRDELSAQAAAKAAEVRKQKMEKQGVFGQINVIESKKKALVEIRQGVEARIEELRKQAEKDKTDEAEKIRNKAWASVELENGSPTAAAKQRRENQVAEYTEQRYTKLQEEEIQVRNSVAKQDAELLAEIRSDQKKITGLRTVSSMGGELKVSYGAYSGENKGWNAYLSLYSESILLYQDTFLISYKALTGKDAPNIAKASDSVMQDYSDTVDMYNSLLLRGDPVLYYEIDYTVSAAPDDEPSKYTFDFKTLRVINTVSGTLAQTIPLGKRLTRTMSPVWDIRSLYLYLYMSGTMIQGCDPDTLPLNLVIPDGVTEIGKNAFKDCSSLESITIPDSVTSIGDSAFSRCTSLTSITIPASVTSIGKYAFIVCSSLKSITIPDSVTTIGGYAFKDCSSLASITIPASVTSIGDSAFFGCKSLVVQFGGTMARWKAIQGKGDWFSGVHCTDGIIGVAEAPAYLKMEGTKITDYDKNTLPSNLVIPEGVTEIGYRAFSGCTSLKSVTIPASVTKIDDSAFSRCTSLTSITIPASVTEIGYRAFSGCTSLHVYYAGTKARWKKIKGKDNEDLDNATMHYESKGPSK